MKLFYLIPYLIIAAISGCTSINGMHFPVTEELQSESKIGDQVNIIKVNANNIKEISKATTIVPPALKPSLLLTVSHKYKIGPSDVLNITLWQTPEGPGSDSTPNVVVNEKGNIYYPFAGEVQVVGLSTDEVRQVLVQKLSAYIKSPQVDVTVAQFNAHQVTLLGSVIQPGQIPITNVPLTLLDAVNSAGINDNADLSSVILRRSNREYFINVDQFILNGNIQQNPYVIPGDVIIINEFKNKQIFTFGEIGVGEITFTKVDPSLTLMLAKKNGLNKNRADMRGVFVFRKSSSSSRINVFQFAMDQPAILVLAQAFQMRDGDVLFVTSDPVTRWNDTLTKILSPVITTIKAQAVVEAVD